MSLFQDDEPQAIEVKGHQLSCPICGNKAFFTRQAQLNTAGATFFNLDWANRSATCFICSDCTHISWFLSED
jgi:predicted nucleic-acid-binding Zn-ribbon protein